MKKTPFYRNPQSVSTYPRKMYSPKTVHYSHDDYPYNSRYYSSYPKKMRQRQRRHLPPSDTRHEYKNDKGWRPPPRADTTRSDSKPTTKNSSKFQQLLENDQLMRHTTSITTNISNKDTVPRLPLNTQSENVKAKANTVSNKNDKTPLDSLDQIPPYQRPFKRKNDHHHYKRIRQYSFRKQSDARLSPRFSKDQSYTQGKPFSQEKTTLNTRHNRSFDEKKVISAT